MVKCNQEGRVYEVKYSALTILDAAEVTETDLFPGSQVLMCMKGKSYAVTVLVNKERKTRGLKLSLYT